jgi:hypothetical protein
MSSSKIDSGRIETVLAAVVLLAVIGLFVRFQLVETNTPPEPTQIEAPAAAEPSSIH